MHIAALIIFVLTCGARAEFAATPKAAEVRNFGEVNDHLYRGAVPSASALQTLNGMGVKLVIDLREASKETGVEKTQVETLGIHYVNVPMRATSTPTEAEVAHVLSLLSQNENNRVFVHCRRGKDRTGTVIACYRIQHDGWSNQRAQAEANSYGMSRMERGMRAFIIHFTPLSVPQMLNALYQP